MNDKSPELYNRLVGRVKPPQPIWGETLESEEVIELRDRFFATVKRSLEAADLSPGIIETGLKVQRRILPAAQGESTDMTDELTIAKVPLAFALQTTERSLDVVRFGTFPVYAMGRRAFAALELADAKLTNAIFRH